MREATIRAMNEITGPILAITLVLSALRLQVSHDEFNTVD